VLPSGAPRVKEGCANEIGHLKERGHCPFTRTTSGRLGKDSAAVGDKPEVKREGLGKKRKGRYRLCVVRGERSTVI